MSLTARCHCGGNVFEIAADLPAALTRCTCSFCSKRGMLYAYFAPEQFKVVRAEGDAVYRWNSRRVAHHHCTTCGCGLYADVPAFEADGQRPATTPRIGFNARLLDDVEAADHPVTVIDGKHLW